MLIPVLLFIVGLLFLIKGGDWFVDGASALARRFHLPELLIGATVVSIGTTLPEVMVSTMSALSGHGEIAYGNAIGSVICNAALIAAITIAVRPGKVDPKTLKTPVAFFFAAAAIYCIAAYVFGRFTRVMGIIMLAMFVAYMAVNVLQMKNTPAGEQEASEEEEMPLAKTLILLVLGAVLILCAAGLLGYNRWDAARAEKASQEVLGELEQTMQKTITEHQQENETAAPQPVLDPTQEMTTVEVEGRDYIGVLSIPAVERELPVMAQWSYAGLKIAPGRYSGTTYGDDLVICGHNYAMHFSPIKWLAIGSSVYFTDADGLRWSYEVESVETLRPTQIEEMTTDTETDNWDLTLFTCTSGGGSRYAVRCVRKGYPVRVTDAAE